ncbi:MAG: hypothetical protein CL768_06215 [Chloroflexi bacterium]|nr:hypothetical protein [Chloroflexota bacterium]
MLPYDENLNNHIDMDKKSKNILNGVTLVEMFSVALSKLEENIEAVNSLNVFPVPDGDTGTNMVLTLKSVVESAQNGTVESAGEVAKIFSKAALNGARGNSGVILYSFIKGFSLGIGDSAELNDSLFVKSLEQSKISSYKSVSKPVEGTMLTVISRIYDIASKSLSDVSGLKELLEIIVKEANKTVKETQFMLPVLEKAGVVDSGGYGLQLILEGMYQYTAGLSQFESLDVGSKVPDLSSSATSGLLDSTSSDSGFMQSGQNVDDLHNIEKDDYGYCTQFLVAGNKLDVDAIREDISKIGSSTVVIGDANNVRIHVHIEDPGAAISFMISYGVISEVSIQNMDQQHEEFRGKIPTQVNGFSIIAVAAGSGICELFRQYGVDAIVEAGQTSNPSIKQLLDAIDKVESEEVVLLPNNSNIILSANEAAKSSGKNVSVIPSKSIPQGISALLALDKEKPLELNLPSALDVIEDICVGEIAKSVRPFKIDGGAEIEKGEYLGVLNGEVVVGGKDLVRVALDLIRKGLTDSFELVSIYWSDSVGLNLAEEISKAIADNFENIDVEIFEGNQPIYDLIISME